MKNSKSLIAASLLFIACLGLGFWIAQRKPLWNDEYYSQISSVHNISYISQFAGRISEGANAPLFYSLQKFILQMFHYQLPSQWAQGWSSDPVSQILLRINPIIFMSLSIVVVFHYFYRRYSWVTGLYALFIFLSSYMLWTYWWQARPYALWMFLTTVQSVILLKRVDPDPKEKKNRLWIMLAVTHILLSLTSILSLGQIAAGSLLWWMSKERDWKKYILLFALPLLIVLFYYAQAPKYAFFFGLSPEQLIRDNISRQRFYILFMFLSLLIVYGLSQKIHLIKYAPHKEILKPIPYVIFMILVLASAIAVLGIFGLHAKEGQGFAITSRYFIYLTPIGAIATTVLSVAIIKSLSAYRWVQWLFMGLIGFLMIKYFLKIVPRFFHSL